MNDAASQPQAWIRNGIGAITGLFRGDPGYSWTLIMLFVAIHGVVIYNACLHDPNACYDSAFHSLYMTAISEGRLPTPEDTPQFYNPPLPYLFPAALKAFAGVSDTAVFRTTMYSHVAVSMIICLLVLQFCSLFRPGCLSMKCAALGLLGMQPVYYRTLAFFRSEPLFALVGLVVLLTLLGIVKERRVTGPRLAVLGLSCGMLLLIRPTGLFLLSGLAFPCLVIAMRWKAQRRWVLASVAAAVLSTVIIAGWWYVLRYQQYGMVFNRKATPLSIANVDGSFYLGTGDGKLFAEPFMPHFQKQFLPVFYAEWWGDYYGFFLVYARRFQRIGDETQVSNRTLALTDSQNWVETNYYERVPYLGRANIAALIPSVLLLCALVASGIGFLVSLARNESVPIWLMRGLLAASVVALVLGLILVVLRYPDTILLGAVKATYVFPIFPLLSVLGADLLAEVRSRSRAAFGVLVAGLIAVALHNAPTLVTVFTS